MPKGLGFLTLVLIWSLAGANILPPATVTAAATRAPEQAAGFQAETVTPTESPIAETAVPSEVVESPTAEASPTPEETTPPLPAPPAGGDDPTAEPAPAQATETVTPTTTVTPSVTVTPTTTLTPTEVATSPVSPVDPDASDVVTLTNGYRISFLGSSTQGSLFSTWRYRVEELPGAQDLSNWVLGLPGCFVVEISPKPAEVVNPDPNAGINGVRWQTGAGFSSGEFTVVLLGQEPQGLTTVAAKGADVALGQLAGPNCGGGTQTGGGDDDDDDDLPEIEIELTGGYRVTLLSFVNNGNGTTTWRYRVEELPNTPDLAAFVLGVPACIIGAATPVPYSLVNPDPNTGLRGVRWETTASFSSGEFSVTLAGAAGIGLVQVAAQSSGVGFGALAGPVCRGSGGGGGGDDDDDDGGNDDDDDGGDDDDDDGGNDDDDDGGRPTVIVIRPDDVRQEVTIVNNISIVAWNIVFVNTGSNTRNVVIVIDHDVLLQFGDLSFLEGIGEVQEVGNGRVRIRINGGNTLARDARVNLRITFRAQPVAVEQRLQTTIRIRYVDQDDDRETEGLPVLVVIPALTIIVPLPRLGLERIDIRFRGRWEQGGGLRIYGLPLTEPVTLTTGITVQYFERARFEYHPEFAGTQYEVLLGLLGVELGFVQPALPPPTSTTNVSGTYVAETGHFLAPQFLSFWNTRGGLPTFGYPIGEAFVDDRGLLVQYFERCRLEFHPEFAGSEYEILLGFLGEDVLNRRGGNPGDDDDD
jgi:hypothetical protein